MEDVIKNKNILDIKTNQTNTNNINSDSMKSLFNHWGKIINTLVENGNHSFGVTINLPKNPIYLVEDYMVECLNYSWDGRSMKLDFSGQRWSDKQGLWPEKNIYGHYDSLEYVNCLSRDNILYSSLKKCLEKYFIVSVFFSVIENKNNKYHIHILLSIKNFIDYNYSLKNNLYKIILLQLQTDYKELDWDIRVDSLLYFKDIKNWIIYIHKNIKSWTNKSLLIVEYSINKPLTDELNLIYKYKVNPSDALDVYSINFQYPIKDDYNTDSYFFNIKLKNISGIKNKDNILNQRVLINILQYYLILNEYYIYNDNIYEKIKESKISYRLVGTIKNILYDKFQENVVKFYLVHLIGYFEGFDFSYLMDNYFIKSKNIIESIKDISTQRIIPDFGLIEFTDGVYSIKYDRFFHNEIDYNFSNKISTIKYYNKSYNRVRQDKPTNWINGIKNALGINGDEFVNNDYIRICLSVVNPIHKNLFNKNSTLFIYGKSNTGKTTLIGSIYINFFGDDKVGSYINNRNFKYQDLIGKVVGLIDEGRYTSSMSSDLLKIIGQERITIEKKYSKEHVLIDPIPIIILTNMMFDDKNNLVDVALKNRLYIIEFINTISKENLSDSENYKIKLKNEEPNIIVYCNKLLFRFKDKDSIGKIGKRISNKKILDKIKN